MTLYLLLANRVIIGKMDFAAVPSTLKSGVYTELQTAGMEFLAGEYKPESN